MSVPFLTSGDGADFPFTSGELRIRTRHPLLSRMGSWLEVADAVGTLSLRNRMGGDTTCEVEIRCTLLLPPDRDGIYRKVGLTDVGTVVADLRGGYHLLTEDGTLTRLLRPLVRDTGLRRSGFARIRDFLS